MSRVLIILAIIVINAVAAREYWQCNNDGSISCLKSQTCCRGPNGFACYNNINTYQSLQCCSDGNACPNGTICNLREKKCDIKQLSFLAANTTDTFIQPVTQPSIRTSTEKFALGFIEGLSFFKNVIVNKECKYNDPQLIDDVTFILSLLKSINATTDFVPLMESVILRLQDIQLRITKIEAACYPTLQQIQVIIVELFEYLSHPNYEQKVLPHAMLNFNKIITLVQNGTNFLIEKEYEQAGKSFGKLVRFAGFWDYKN